MELHTIVSCQGKQIAYGALRKDAFTEQFALQQMKSIENASIHHYTNNDSTLEIDFVVQYKNSILPIEVKAEENLQSKSLKSFLAKYPNLHGIRFSMSPYKKQESITNVPLGCIKGFFEDATHGTNYL